MTICHAMQEDEKELVFKFGFVGRSPKCKMQNANSKNGVTIQQALYKKDFLIGDNYFLGVECQTLTTKNGFCFSKRLQSCLILHFAFCILHSQIHR